MKDQFAHTEKFSVQFNVSLQNNMICFPSKLLIPINSKTGFPSIKFCYAKEFRKRVTFKLIENKMC